MKQRAVNNRTITLNDDDKNIYRNILANYQKEIDTFPANSIFNNNLFDVIRFIPDSYIDLLFLDPPYNLTKQFSGNSFSKKNENEYMEWFSSWFLQLVPKLKNTASVYICCDWQTSVAIYNVIKGHLKVRNRITWEREKGRGSKINFKNSHEDIWYATVSDKYTFNIDDVKLKRRVLAPYRVDGKPKDWDESEEGNFRLTHPSNFWNDISIPFWSMPENTDHPTQKPEKLLAKLILASTNKDELVFDPFAGVCTSAVTAKKLGRNYIAVELEEEYAMLGLKRLAMAEKDTSIQGYHDGVFWERNSLRYQK